MKLCLVEKKYFKQIRDIDYKAFSREEPRKLTSIATLNQSAPEGCFVALEGRKVVGFIFCKVFGSEGFIGPFGVNPDFQGKGYGKMLLNASIEYLKTQCSVIGLEVNPSMTRNICVYNDAGFITAFPTVIFDTSASFTEPLPKDYKIRPIRKNESPLWLERLDSRLKSEFNGISYFAEIQRALAYDGRVLAAFENDEPAGFIAYCPTTSPFAWGAIKGLPEQADVLQDLINSINSEYGVHVPVAVNGRFINAMTLLSSCRFKVKLSMNRMLLKGYEGDYFSTSDKLMLKAWMN